MSKVYVVAEIASSHEGDADLAFKQFTLAAGTGVDAVKFQIFHRDSLIARGHPKFTSFGEIELSPTEWHSLLARAGASTVDILVEVYDETSLALAEASGIVAAYKIPTSDIANPVLLRAVARTGKPLQLAVGGATDAEVAEALAVLHTVGSPDITIMHGFQSYPTKPSDANLARLRSLASRFSLPVGFADHSDAEDRDLAFALPAMAVASGATVIEKHITDDRSRHGRDHYSALNPTEFTSFVQLLRAIASSMGDGTDRLTPAEESYRQQMKRHAVAARDLVAGRPLSGSDLAFKRTGLEGISPADADRLIGRVLRRARSRDEPVGLDDVR